MMDDEARRLHVAEIREVADMIERGDVEQFFITMMVAENRVGADWHFEQDTAAVFAASMVAQMRCECGNPNCEVLVFKRAIVGACAKLLGCSEADILRQFEHPVGVDAPPSSFKFH